MGHFRGIRPRLRARRFHEGLRGNRAEAVQETLESDPVGLAILGFMETEELWEGTCKQLLQKLEQDAPEGSKQSREWPKSPRALSSRLRRLVTFLREMGIFITFHARGTNGQRIVTLTRRTVDSTVTTVISPPGCLSDQSVTPGGVSDGPGLEVADGARAAERSPLEPAVANSPEAHEYEPKVAVVTVVTVDSGHLNGNLP
jgi:hypothetical protein